MYKIKRENKIINFMNICRHINKINNEEEEERKNKEKKILIFFADTNSFECVCLGAIIKCND